MSNLFQSRVDFKPEELEFMITDLKDIMGCLTEKNVLDLTFLPHIRTGSARRHIR